MNYVINLNSMEDLDFISACPAEEILLQSSQFSRFGGMGFGQLLSAAGKLKSIGKKCTLAWDLLVPERLLSAFSDRLKEILPHIDAIRILDPGVGSFIAEHDADINLQLTLEHGSHNVTAISEWCRLLKKPPDKLVLSSQIPFENIPGFRHKVPADIELLVFGRIEILYSARKLLQPLRQKGDFGKNRRFIASKDRPSQKNSIIETSWGTVVFYDKYLNLLSKLGKIEHASVDSVRFEFFDAASRQFLELFFENSVTGNDAGRITGVEQTEGFFAGNDTDRLFENLSNPFIKRNVEKKIGSVIDAARDTYTFLEFTDPLPLPANIVFLSPERKEIPWRLEKVQDLNGTTHVQSLEPGYYTIPWVKSAVPGSIILNR